MRILLVNPPRYLEKIPVIREDRCEITERYAVMLPYSLLWIAAILRNKGHVVNFIDANALNLSYSALKEKMKTVTYDAMIFRFVPTTFDWDMKTAESSKEINPNGKTIGICLTLWSLQNDLMQVSPHLDFYVPLEWETVIPNLINTLEKNGNLSKIQGVSYRIKNKISVNSPVTSMVDYDSLPIPAYDLISDFTLYRPNTPVQGNYSILYTSKGCPYSCIYCTVSRTPFKIKSAERVVEEIKFLNKNFHVKLFSFFDETFTIDRKRVISISDAIRDQQLDVQWYCNTRVNLVDKELLQIMYNGGCRGIAYGIESGSQKILNDAEKDITIEQAKNAIKWTKESGIKVFTSFIFGLPGENWQTIQETISFVKETLPHGAQFNVAVPYPGTPLYSYALEKGLLSDTDWQHLYQHKALMRTEQLSSKDLEEARKMAYRKLYFNYRWIMSNVRWILKDSAEFQIAVKYYFKVLKNYLIYQMEHAH